MKRFKDFIFGFTVCLLLFVLVIPAAAAGINTILEYNNIKINLDGKQIDPKDINGRTVEPFIIGGTVYLPVRAVSEMLGLNVDWDDVNKTVLLFTPEAAASLYYNKTKPAPVGITQKINVGTNLTAYTATVTITELLRGDAAWAEIQQANMYNDEPEAGKEYILAKIKLTASNVKDDKAVSLSGFTFTVFSADNIEYTSVFGTVVPSPAFHGDIYEGDTLEGYAAYTVNKNDAAPKAVFGENYDGTGGIWFALYK